MVARPGEPGRPSGSTDTRNKLERPTLAWSYKKTGRARYDSRKDGRTLMQSFCEVVGLFIHAWMDAVGVWNMNDVCHVSIHIML